jgi:uncharacterized protein YktB (UPF0637 family)
VQFPGFEPGDFELFAIPDFAGRMAEIRARVRPKLIALGDDLTDRISAVVGMDTFPHVAQHMRRRVNPPEETWVAFTRDKRGYKRWTHYRIAISGRGLRVTVFVEDDADDKPQLGQNLQAAGTQVLKALGDTPVLWYTLDGAEPVPQSDVKPQALRELGSTLQRLKTVKFQAGVPLSHGDAVKLSPEKFESWALQQIGALKPLYLAGATPGYRP